MWQRCLAVLCHLERVVSSDVREYASLHHEVAQVQCIIDSLVCVCACMQPSVTV